MRRSLAGIVPQEILWRGSKQLGAAGHVLVLEKHWDELQSIYQTPLSAQPGYIDAVQLLKTIREARSGKIVSLVRVLRTIFLEHWLRRRAGLLRPACRSLDNARAEGTSYERLASTSNDFPPPTYGDGIFQQRRTTMNYSKPEVNTLGQDTMVIEAHTSKNVMR